MTTDYEYPKVAAGGSIYLCFGVKTIAGEYLVPSDVTAITLNIYELLEPTNHVSGYYGLSIPASAILSDPLTVQGKTVNFYHNPAHDGVHLADAHSISGRFQHLIAHIPLAGIGIELPGITAREAA